MTTKNNVYNRKKEAAEWFALYESDDISSQQQSDFESWINSDPENRLAYKQLKKISSKIELLSRVNQAIPELIPGNLKESIAECHDLMVLSSRRNQSMKIFSTIAASFLVVLTSVFLWQFNGLESENESLEYKTLVGQQLTQMLDDGSLVTLNTDSKLKVSFTKNERRLHLFKGEVYFDVAKDPNRPFIVSSKNIKASAIGTAFTVRNRANKVEVTVFEGKVKVESNSNVNSLEKIIKNKTLKKDKEINNAQLYFLSPGEKIIHKSSSNEISKQPVSNLEKADSWRKGKVIFDNKSIAEMIDEIQFYIPDRIIITSKKIAAMKMGGTFYTDNTKSFFSALDVIDSIKIIKKHNVIIITEDSE